MPNNVFRPPRRPRAPWALWYAAGVSVSLEALAAGV
jgi:hypothetical protein